MSGNRTLVNLWSQLRGLISSLIEISTGNVRELDFVEQSHDALLSSLRAGYANRAIAVLEEHFRTGEAIISDFLEHHTA